MDSRLTEMNWSISSFVASFLFSLYKKNLYTEVVGHLPLTSSESTSLAVQWLRLRASAAGGAGSIPGQEARIPHALGLGQKNPPKSALNGLLYMTLTVLPTPLPHPPVDSRLSSPCGPVPALEEIPAPCPFFPQVCESFLLLMLCGPNYCPDLNALKCFRESSSTLFCRKLGYS